jgi:predicted PurR-regulated permease PerM
MIDMLFRRSKDDDVTEVSIIVKTETYVKVAALIIGTVIVFAAARRASHALVLIFAAFFLALALNAPVNWVSQRLPGKTRGNRSLATSLSFLLVVIVFGVLLASTVPSLVQQTQGLVSAAPTIIKDFRSQDSTVGQFIRKHNLQDQVGSISNQLQQRLKNVGGAAFTTIQQIGSSIFSVLTVLVLTFMMLVEGPRWIRFARRLTPHKHHKLAERMGRDMYLVIKGYVNGQVTLAALAAVLIAPAVIFFGISYPAALVVIIFICGLIPMVGHTIGAVIITIVAAFHSLTSAFIILAYYILYQQVENYLIQPRIQANSTNMSPLLVFSSVIIGVSFGGLLGGLVAIPVAGCLRIAVLEYLKSHGIISKQDMNQLVDSTPPTPGVA